MRNECFDIGVIQTFVDGELSLEKTEDVLRHLSTCEACTETVALAEAENEMAFAALSEDLNPLVPTERLRAKVFASIEEIESYQSIGFWQRLAAGFGFASLLARPQAAAFASVVLMLGITGAVLWYGLNPFGQDVSPVDPHDLASAQQASVTEITPSVPESQPDVDGSPLAGTPPSDEPGALPAPNNEYVVQKVSQSASRSSGRRKPRIRKRASRPAVIAQPAVLLTADVEAEEAYIRTISTLNRTVNENKDFVLRPSERVVFERDLAVVDDAIKKMREQVRKNPNDAAAREVLKSSYKSKIDLLNSVADRAETVASLD